MLAMTIVRISAALGLAYLLGGIPWSLIVGKRFFGVDLRQHGSGNLGATNVFRTLGARAGISVALLDVSKGALAVLLAMLLVGRSVGPEARDWWLIASGFAAVLGHTVSPYIKLRGGKGVATAAGAVAVLMPLSLPILVLTWVLVIVISRMVSLGSVIIAIEFPLLIALLYGDRKAYVVFSAVVAALVVWKHRGNIARIVRGEESKISLSRRGSAVRRDEEG